MGSARSSRPRTPARRCGRSWRSLRTGTPELVESAIGLRESGTGFDIRQTFWAVRRLLEVLAEDGPLVVVIDDVHWAETTFLQVLAKPRRGSAGWTRRRLSPPRPFD